MSNELNALYSVSNDGHVTAAAGVLTLTAALQYFEQHGYRLIFWSILGPGRILVFSIECFITLYFNPIFAYQTYAIRILEPKFENSNLLTSIIGRIEKSFLTSLLVAIIYRMKSHIMPVMGLASVLLTTDASNK